MARGRPRRPSRGPCEGAPARQAAPARAREHDDDLQRPRVLPGARSCRSSSPRPARSTATSTGSRATGRTRPTSPSRRARTRLRRSRREAFIYSYAKCYDLRYLVFRFSNVYGRYDNDLRRMERVIPLFIHQLGRGEPITVYGGDEKVLDFTFIDDCIDGITRGVERLAAGQSRTRRSTSPTARATRSSGRPSSSPPSSA